MSTSKPWKRLAKWSRKTHRWATIVVAAPLLLVLVTGVLLQVKKEFDYLQPPTRRGSADAPLALAFDDILQRAQAIPELEVERWSDVARLDVRPGKNVIKVRSTNRWEAQLDGSTGKVLQVMRRRSDLIEELHDGSWFHGSAKLWIFLPAALLALGLWLTGLVMFVAPHLARRRRRAG